MSAAPLPPYTHVPGRTPHPESDPAGHSYGKSRNVPEPLDASHWWLSSAYRRGVLLFNHGYYWEAHEAWEGLWLAAGRRGPTANLLQALIHLAAAGVKIREGVPAGVVSHARRAAHHLTRLPASASCAGLQRRELEGLCRHLQSAAEKQATANLRPGPLLPLLTLAQPPVAQGDDHG